VGPPTTARPSGSSSRGRVALYACALLSDSVWQGARRERPRLAGAAPRRVGSWRVPAPRPTAANEPPSAGADAHKTSRSSRKGRRSRWQGPPASGPTLPRWQVQQKPTAHRGLPQALSRTRPHLYGNHANDALQASGAGHVACFAGADSRAPATFPGVSRPRGRLLWCADVVYYAPLAVGCLAGCERLSRKHLAHRSRNC
jgi:hypothetical protein